MPYFPRPPVLAVSYLMPYIARDIAIIEAPPDYNTNGDAVLDIWSAFGQARRVIFDFGDISSLVTGGTIFAALKLQCTTIFTAEPGTLVAYPMTTFDWVETEVTWDDKATGVDWTDGGEFTLSGATTGLVAPTSTGPVIWDISQTIRYIAATNPTTCQIMVKCTTENTTGQLRFADRTSATPPQMSLFNTRLT